MKVVYNKSVRLKSAKDLKIEELEQEIRRLKEENQKLKKNLAEGENVKVNA
jgi:hypothetical protein